MKYRQVSILALLGLLSMTGCRPASNEPPESAAPTETVSDTDADLIHLAPKDAQANGVMSAEVVEDTVVPTITVSARVRTQSGAEVQVFSPFSGRLIGESPLPRIGDSVAKGQHLADVEQQLTASETLQVAATVIELQSGIEQAGQEVGLRQTEVDRAQQLYDGGAIPLKQLQTAQFELQQAQSKLEGARRAKEQYDAVQSPANSQPRRAPILAPISGTVIAVDAVLGQQVDSDKGLLTVADLGTVWVEAAVHERDLPRTRGARSAEMTVPGFLERPLTGTLVTIGNLVDAENRTVPMIFNVRNPERLLKIGMFVEAHIPTGPAVKALLIPVSAVLSQESADSVYVEAEPGVFRKQPVELGSRKDAMVVVIHGLTKGERVVTAGAQALLGESLKSEIPVEEEEKEDKEP